MTTRTDVGTVDDLHASAVKVCGLDDFVPIERPIFVTGLPRTGTTAIHRLLTADPRHQGLELWLAEFPQPRPPRETWPQNPVFQQLDAQFSKAHGENPDYTGLHYMTADEV